MSVQLTNLQQLHYDASCLTEGLRLFCAKSALPSISMVFLKKVVTECTPASV